MKLYLLEFALWLYVNHIEEDWSTYTKLGKISIYPFWVIRSILIWLTFPLWMISFQFTKSEAYKHYQEFGKAMTMEQQLEMIKQQKVQRKIQTKNFLNKKR